MYFNLSFVFKIVKLRVTYGMTTLYESTFIVRQDASNQEVDKISDSFEKIITDRGGKIVRRENWGLRNLAYKINKYKKGHYVMLAAAITNDGLVELNRQYGLNESVVRNLTVKVDAISKEPSSLSKEAKKS